MQKPKHAKNDFQLFLQNWQKFHSPGKLSPSESYGIIHWVSVRALWRPFLLLDEFWCGLLQMDLGNPTCVKELCLAETHNCYWDNRGVSRIFERGGGPIFLGSLKKGHQILKGGGVQWSEGGGVQ